jgi:hypothetical protein
MDRHIRLLRSFNFPLCIAFLMLIAFCLVNHAYAAGVGNSLSIGSYQLVSKQRVGRTTYTYRTYALTTG